MAPFAGATPPAATDPYLRLGGATPITSPAPAGTAAGGTRLSEDSAPSPTEPVRRDRPHTQGDTIWLRQREGRDGGGGPTDSHPVRQAGCSQETCESQG